MAQQSIILNPQVITQIATHTNQKWRSCVSKEYDVYAVIPPANMCCANKLEQPKSYALLQQKYKANIVPTAVIAPTDAQFLKANGCYITDGQCVLLCGTQGELRTTKIQSVFESYITPDNNFNNVAGFESVLRRGWTRLTRKTDATEPKRVGIVIPNQYLAALQTSYGTIIANDPMTPGHGAGDLFVIKADANGNPDFSSGASIINNTVFALTMNQTQGGWAQSGLITNAANIQPLTKEILDKYYAMPHTGLKADTKNIRSVLYDFYANDTVSQAAKVAFKTNGIIANEYKLYLAPNEFNLPTENKRLYGDYGWQGVIAIMHVNVANDPMGIVLPTNVMTAYFKAQKSVLETQVGTLFFDATKYKSKLLSIVGNDVYNTPISPIQTVDKAEFWNGSALQQCFEMIATQMRSLLSAMEGTPISVAIRVKPVHKGGGIYYPTHGPVQHQLTGMSDNGKSVTSQIKLTYCTNVVPFGSALKVLFYAPVNKEQYDKIAPPTIKPYREQARAV